MTVDPDPLTVDPEFGVAAYDAGYDAGLIEAQARQRLSIRPFAYGLAAGAAVALIIALVVLR